MDFHGRTRQYRHPGLVVQGLVALLALFLSTAAGAATAEMILEPERVVKGSRFLVRIKTDIPWTSKYDVAITRPELPKNLVWWGYPEAQPWSEQMEDGSYRRMVEVRAKIHVDAPGFYEVGPFLIRSGDDFVDTGTRPIIGLEPDEANLPYPIFTQWRSPPETVWQGEAVPLILEGQNFASLALADSVSLASAPHGLLEEAPGLGGIISRSYGKEVLYDVPMASWIWTQDEPGTYRFPYVQLNIGGMKRTTPGFEVEVLPVPEEALISGAVGRFQVSFEIEEGEQHVGDVVSVRVRVEGEGNFNILKPPVAEANGATLVGQGSASSYIPGSYGFTGWREERYDFQIERAGNITFSIPGWTWFDPTGDGALRRGFPQSSSVQALPSAEEAAEVGTLALLGDKMFRYPSAVFHWRNSYWFLAALPGFIFLVLVFLRKRPGAGTLAALVLPLMLSASNIDAELALEAAAIIDIAETGDWGAARIACEGIREKTGAFPGLLHDMAVVEMELGNPDLAVSYMRRANNLRPGSSYLKEELRLLEERLALDEQIPLSMRMSPAIIFGILLGSINLTFLMIAALLYWRDPRMVILALSIFLLLAAGITATVVFNRLWGSPTAVVRTDAAPLRKIPGPLATDWIQLPAGTAVSVVARDGSYNLVRTGYGLEGWLPVESMIEPAGGSDGL